MKSIIQSEKKCFLCGQNHEYGPNRLEEHHIFFGNPDRKHSEKHGLKVYLCGDACHRNGSKSPHKNRAVDIGLKAMAQSVFEETHSREEFMSIFGRNYL
jgi:hypothetical protein